METMEKSRLAGMDVQKSVRPSIAHGSHSWGKAGIRDTWRVVPLILVMSLPLVAADLPSPLNTIELQDGDTVVFLGDSITHQCLYTQYLEDYFYTRFPDRRIRFHNAGVSGSVAWEALERFDRDVASYKPKYVTLMLGMNDGNHEPFNPAVFATYRQDMSAILDRIQKIGAMPIILSPTMFDARMRRIRRPDADAESTAMYNAVLAYYGAWLREIGVERGWGFVDLWSPLNNITLSQRKRDASFTLIPDSVHPAPAGHVVMAAAFVNDLDLPREVSSIRVNLTGTDQTRIDATGGKAFEIVRDVDQFQFRWHARCLPWVLPDQADSGVKLIRLGHSYGRESIEIHGLKPGDYTFMIDGQEIGDFGSAELEHGIELQDNPRTPQHRQALAVAQLNAARNSGPVSLLRDEWWNFQDFVDIRRDALTNPNDKKIQENLLIAQEKIRDMDRRIAQATLEIQKFDDKIAAANKPLPRVYLFRRK